MVFRKLGVVVSAPSPKTYYEHWMEKEGVPIIEGSGVRDLRDLTLGHWKRLGCEGAYLQLGGLDGTTGVYVGKLAPGRSLEPEKHLYEKIVYILQGEGVAEIQQQGRLPQVFTWHAGSVLSPPMNATHRLINHSDEPAVFLAVTTAPMALEHYRNERFVFNNDFAFVDRYDGERDYFEPREERCLSARSRKWSCEANFIPDARAAMDIDSSQASGSLNVIRIEMSGNALIGRLAGWPVGACYHGSRSSAAEVLVILSSEGYSLMWPEHLGSKPFEHGHADRVVRVDWQPGTVFGAPANYVQRHFNTGGAPALQLALGCGSEKFPLGNGRSALLAGAYASNNWSEAAAERDDEDREIRRVYETALRLKGIVPEPDYAVAANGD